ncbi:MAG: hypothetical protein KIT44_04050 [Opitutaceae bacterium]|nr:hypothetical protein [Opitutaceae bacterium]
MNSTRFALLPARLLLTLLVAGSASSSRTAPSGAVDAEAATAAGPVARQFDFPAAPPPRVHTPTHAVVALPVGTFGERLAADGTVLVSTYTDVFRWRAGHREDLLFPSGYLNLDWDMNRHGDVIGSTSQGVPDDNSTLSTQRGWYWPAGEAFGQEIFSPVTYLGYDERSASFHRISGVWPGWVDDDRRIWGYAPYQALDDQATALWGLVRWTGASSPPSQIGYDQSHHYYLEQIPPGPSIELTDVNTAGTMVGWRVFHGGSAEDFIGHQAVDFAPAAINEAGWVVGYDWLDGQGVFWREGAAHVLLGLRPTRINQRGDIVGETADGWVLLPVEALPEALDAPDFDYTPYLIEDLFPEGWEVVDVADINDDGALVGTGLYLDPESGDGFYEIRAFLLLPSRLRVDVDRDGRIEAGTDPDNPDLLLTREGLPWHYWLNDDDDAGATEGDDIPEAGNPNHADNRVNGPRDLVDFFPVHLDIAPLLRAFSPEDPAITYRIAQADAALAFFATELTPDRAGDYLRVPAVADALGEAAVTVATEEGAILDRAFLGRILTSGQGIILCEARRLTQAPLRLEVWRGPARLAQLTLPLSFSGVEDMFRHVNLTGAVGLAPRTKSRGGAPNWPVELENDQAFVFLHGYNNNPEQARGWHAEVFKRFFWSGSRAQFWGVTWYGHESQKRLGGARVSPDYHSNVVNAFGTAPACAAFLHALRARRPGGVQAAGFSLGALVISAAISDHTAPVDRLYLIDAAVPTEAFDGSQAQPPAAAAAMPHTEWHRERGEPYPDRLWATEWHRLFPEGDARAALTWRDRLAPRPNTAYYNFHSTGEDILAPPAGGDTPNLALVLARELDNYLWFLLPTRAAEPAGTRSWAYQEQFKGRLLTGKIAGSRFGGWGFNYFDFRRRPGRDGLGPELRPNGLTPPQAVALLDSVFTPETLREEPFFRPGRHRLRLTTWVETGPGGATQAVTDRLGLLYGPETGSAFAARHRSSLLARMIPAMSFATGFDAVEKLTVDAGEARNFDLSSAAIRGVGEPWPAERGPEKKWLHSDLREVAYVYTHGLYKKIVELGELNRDGP